VWLDWRLGQRRSGLLRHNEICGNLIFCSLAHFFAYAGAGKTPLGGYHVASQMPTAIVAKTVGINVRIASRSIFGEPACQGYGFVRYDRRHFSALRQRLYFLDRAQIQKRGCVRSLSARS
jgi:hypothetical protein